MKINRWLFHSQVNFLFTKTGIYITGSKAATLFFLHLQQCVANKKSRTFEDVFHNTFNNAKLKQHQPQTMTNNSPTHDFNQYCVQALTEKSQSKDKINVEPKFLKGLLLCRFRQQHCFCSPPTSRKSLLKTKMRQRRKAPSA